MSDLGARVRAARGYANLSQPQLADKLGISRSTITRLETSGKTVAQGYKEEALIERIAKACDLPDAFFAVDFDRLTELVDPALSPAPEWAQDIAEKVDLILAEILAGPPHAEEDERTEERAA
jgi:transcriptional regulator with XRE-family HTH domain